MHATAPTRSFIYPAPPPPQWALTHLLLWQVMIAGARKCLYPSGTTKTTATNAKNWDFGSKLIPGKRPHLPWDVCGMLQQHPVRWAPSCGAGIASQQPTGDKKARERSLASYTGCFPLPLCCFFCSGRMETQRGLATHQALHVCARGLQFSHLTLR